MAWARMALSVLGTTMRVPEEIRAHEMSRDNLTVMRGGIKIHCISFLSDDSHHRQNVCLSVCRKFKWGKAEGQQGYE